MQRYGENNIRTQKPKRSVAKSAKEIICTTCKNAGILIFTQMGISIITNNTTMTKRFIKVVFFVPAILIAMSLTFVEIVYFVVSFPIAYIIYNDVFKFDIGKKMWYQYFLNWYWQIDK